MQKKGMSMNRYLMTCLLLVVVAFATSSPVFGYQGADQDMERLHARLEEAGLSSNPTGKTVCFSRKSPQTNTIGNEIKCHRIDAIHFKRDGSLTLVGVTHKGRSDDQDFRLLFSNENVWTHLGFELEWVVIDPD